MYVYIACVRQWRWGRSRIDVMSDMLHTQPHRGTLLRELSCGRQENGFKELLLLRAINNIYCVYFPLSRTDCIPRYALCVINAMCDSSAGIRYHKHHDNNLRHRFLIFAGCHGHRCHHRTLIESYESSSKTKKIYILTT